MSRYVGPKCRLCRREGVKLFIKGEKCESPKCPLFRKQQAPGQHGNSRRAPSVYALQLRAKQKAKRIYGVNESQFARFFARAQKTENPSETLLIMLERRLDNVVYRLGAGRSRSHARQLVTHRKVRVNGRAVRSPSFLVSADDKIAFAEGTLVSKEAIIPAWLSLAKGGLEAVVLKLPERADAEKDIDESLLVEFYAR